MLPIWCCPAVTKTLPVPPAPRPERHRIDVSDSHSVPSHPVGDNLVCGVIAKCPKLPPCKVKLAPAESARFAFLNALIIALSVVNIFVDVAMSPIVMETRVLAVTAAEAWHCSPESDSHRVISHVVADNRAMPEYRITPKFSPRSVKLTDPVVGLFPSTSMLWLVFRSRANARTLARSVVTASVNVPDLAPAVTVTLC